MSGPAVPGAQLSVAGKTATTDSTGAFTISGIPAGSYALTISATGYGNFSNSAYAISANQNGIKFALTPNVSGFSMSGRIHSGSAGGPAISWALVSMAGKNATTDASGAFSITGISAGSYTLTISASGYSSYSNGSYAITADQSGRNFALLPASGNVRVSGSSLHFSQIQPAYNGAADGAAIMSQAMLFTENLILNSSKAVLIKGGYSAAFAGQSGYTTLHGSLKIARGRVAADHFKIR